MSVKGDTLRLQGQLETKFDKREKRPQRFRAIMGDGTGAVKVPGKRNYVYIRRLGRGLIEECLNNKAPARDGLPIIAGCSHESPDLLQVLEVDWTSFAEPGSYAYAPPHHESHEFRNVYGGDDVVWVQKQQVLPLLAHPTSPVSMSVIVLDDWYPWATGWHYFEEVTSADLTAHIPALAGQARYVLISVDGATEALQYTIGDLFPILLPPADAENMIPAPPLGSIPIVGVYLAGVTTAIDWENLYDLRLFNQPVGGSVYPGPHALLDSVAHSDTVTNAPTRGSLVLANATPAWNELVHPGGPGYALTTDANDVVWDQTPAWTGNHTFNAGLTIPAAQAITMGDLAWIGLGPAAGRLTFDDAVPDVASFDGCGHVNIENVLGHIGDPDTYLIFAPDSIVLRAGGVDLIHATTVGVDRVEINPNEDDVDFIVNSAALADTLLVDGATGAISVTGPSLTVPATWNLLVPDNVADAFGIDDIGGLEYMRIVSTNAQPTTVFNFGEDDIDFRVAALGITDALFVQGSTGFVGVGRSTPEGHLDVYDITVNTTISYYGIHNEHVKTLGATDYLDILEGIHNHIEFDQNGAEIGRFTGINSRTILTSGSVGDGGFRSMTGIYNYLWMEDATCTVTDDVQGLFTEVDLGGGTIGDDVMGYHIYVHLRAGLTSVGGDVFGTRIYLHAETDPAGTVYAIYWWEGDNIDYGIYQDGTAPNRFGGNLVLDDGVGDSPQIQFVGGSNNDTILMYLADDAVAGDSDLVVKLCDAAGDSRLLIHDSAAALVAYMDSNGSFWFDNVSGIGIAPSTDIQLFVWGTTDEWIPRYGIASFVQPTHTINTVNTHFGYYGGLRFTGTANYTDVADGQTAVYGAIQMIGSVSTIAKAQAFHAAGFFSGATCTGTITDFAYYRIRELRNVSGGAVTVGTQYGLHIPNLTFATTNYAIYSAGANSYHAGKFAFGGTVAPLAQMHVDQSAAGGAVPVLLLDQADLSEEFIELTTTVGAGNPIDTAAIGTYYGKMRVNITGVGYKYIALYNS